MSTAPASNQRILAIVPDEEDLAALRKMLRAIGHPVLGLTDLDKGLLESLSTEIEFDDLPEASAAILKGRVRGRTIVRIPD